ncbi:MAG: serine/threonine-protein kinase [Streptosporangiaceae bacterium]
MTAAGRNRRKGALGMFFSCIAYLWWFCRLRRENGPTSRYVVGVFALARELQPDDPQSIGPYRLVGQLGQGGMGRVFLGVSPGGRPVAVKAIRAELAANPEFRARFGREVSAARRVSGVFTAQVVDADVDGPVAWMATAYVPGPSLAEAVDTHGPLPEASLLALAAGLAESLNAIHAVGVVHRDLKPSNVLLAEDGPRVIDFGISRAAESTMLTQAGLVVGSPGFMSPEQAMGSDVGPPSDIFNLGAVLAFAATGEGPFGTGTTAALLYRVVHGTPSLDLVPPAVRPLIEHCLAKDPRQRPTANGLLAEVGALQPDGTWLPESFTRTFAQGTPSRPGFAWSGAVAAAAAGAAAGAAVAGSNPALAGTASAYAPSAAPAPAGLGAMQTASAGSGPSGPSGPGTPAPGSWPYTGAGALTATAGSAPPTPPMGAYPPATPPPMPSGTGQPPRRRRIKPLVVALILGGIVGAGGAAAFAVTSFTGQPSTRLEQPAAQTSSATAPASVGPAVKSVTTEPSASQSASSSVSSAPYSSQPTSTYSSPTTHPTTTSPTTPTSPTTSPTTSTSTSAPASAPASTSPSAPASTSSSATPPSSTPPSSESSTTAASTPASPPSSAASS